jgi:hypothetical protein
MVKMTTRGVRNRQVKWIAARVGQVAYAVERLERRTLLSSALPKLLVSTTTPA